MRKFDLVIAANRLPVDRTELPDGRIEWSRSPGGLVTAMESVMRNRDGAWIGWSGTAGEAPQPWFEDGMWLEPIALDAREVADYYEGYSNDSLWPLYHDVIVPATYRRSWRTAYERVNARFAERVAAVAAPGATVWVQDYQLQLLPELVRGLRPDVRIGWFNHIPFPPVELFMQLPGREGILEGLLGADFLGFQRRSDADNFVRACRRLLPQVRVSGEVITRADGHQCRAAAVPISIDARSLRELAQSPAVRARAEQIRADLGNPQNLLLGVDRLDYTKGIRHRIKAFGELLAEGAIDPRTTQLIQVATPSRERLDAYRELRDQVELSVGRLNGEYSPIGHTAVTYLHHSFPREEMAALFVAADVTLVTPLRDGMNLVAKEYVTCHGLDGALVLSEFTGAADELRQAYLCNPHDIRALKRTILQALSAPRQERMQRMRGMRVTISRHDVNWWANAFLANLASAPQKPRRR